MQITFFGQLINKILHNYRDEFVFISYQIKNPSPLSITRLFTGLTGSHTQITACSYAVRAFTGGLLPFVFMTKLLLRPFHNNESSNLSGVTIADCVQARVVIMWALR